MFIFIMMGEILALLGQKTDDIKARGACRAAPHLSPLQGFVVCMHLRRAPEPRRLRHPALVYFAPFGAELPRVTKYLAQDLPILCPNIQDIPSEVECSGGGAQNVANDRNVARALQSFVYQIRQARDF